MMSSQAIARIRARNIRGHNFVCAVLIMSIAGCSGVPTQRYVKGGANPSDARVLPVVIDTCLYRDNALDQDRFVIDASQDAAKILAREVAAYLSENSTAASPPIAPFVCGSLPYSPKLQADEIYVSASVDSPARLATPPFVTAPNFANSSLRSSFSALLQLAVSLQSEKQSIPPPAPAALNVALTDLRYYLKADTVLVVQESGAQVSKAKSFSQGMATGLATVLLFGVGVASMGVSGTTVQTTLIDLRTGAAIWSNVVPQQGGDPMESDFNNRKLVETLLYHMVHADKT